jgi:hypothetical protein
MVKERADAGPLAAAPTVACFYSAALAWNPTAVDITADVKLDPWVVSAGFAYEF